MKNKKNAWVNDVVADSNVSLTRVNVPTDAVTEAGWNIKNCYYVVNDLNRSGRIILTQDGSRSDIERKCTFPVTNGYPLTMVNLHPSIKNRNMNFDRVVIEINESNKEISLTPLCM